MLIPALAFSIVTVHAGSPQFECGKPGIRKRPYGLVELRVDCEDKSEYNVISVLEYKGKKQHGISIHFDSLWRKRDSSFFKNGKEEGLSVFWDTLGNVIGRKTYRNGIQFGKEEYFFAPGRPSLVKHYNSKGEEDGPWSKWWPNGNKRGDFISKRDQIISSDEYYQDGKPRLKFRGKYESKPVPWIERKYVEGESWAPNGKSAGKITKGNGEWILFPDGGDPEHKKVVRYAYKDSILADVDSLTTEEAAKWLAP
jgi:antitoxin component YwqK of YwqJK toxin-antitoxin module